MEDAEEADLTPSDWNDTAMCVAFVLFSLTAIWLRRTYQYYQFFKKLEILGPTPLPFVGNLHSLWKKDSRLVYQQWQNKYGSIFGVFLPKPVLCVCNPIYVGYVLVKQFDSCSDLPQNPVFKFAPMSDSLLAITGDHWKHVKRLLLPTFSAEKMKKLVPTIRRVIINLQTYLMEEASFGGYVDLNSISRRFAMDLIAGVAFGLEVNSLKNPQEPFAVHANAFLKQAASARPYVEKLPSWLLKILSKIGFTVFAKADREYLVGLVEKGLQERRQNGKTYADFLQLLVESEREDYGGRVDSLIDISHELKTSSQWTRKGLTQGEMISNVLMFLFTAYETTATTLCVTLSSLVANPGSLQLVRDEVKRVAGQRPLTFDIMMELSQIEACIEESLRLHVAVNLDRITTQETKLGGYLLPKGLHIKIVGINLHNNHVYWRQPRTFDPRRFTNLSLRAMCHPYSQTSFGHGPRTCLGIRLTQLLVGMTLVSIVRRFTPVFSYVPEYPPQFNLETEKLEGSVWMKFRQTPAQQ